MVLKDLMDDLEVGNRVMDEIKRINFERKPKKVSFNNWGTATAVFPVNYENYATQMQQAPQQQGYGLGQYGSILGGQNGTI